MDPIVRSEYDKTPEHIRSGVFLQKNELIPSLNYIKFLFYIIEDMKIGRIKGRRFYRLPCVWDYSANALSSQIVPMSNAS